MTVSRNNQQSITINNLTQSKNNDLLNESSPIIITGDDLKYNDETSEVFGEGNIVLRQAATTIFSDSIYINYKSGDVSAEGNVMAVDQDSRIYSDKFYYNIKTQSAYTRNAHIIIPPWIFISEKLKKEKERIDLENPVFTTCDKVSPHYRMEAAMIFIHGKKRIEAWHTRVYLGNVPIFYFPYYTQSLEGSKDPFEIRVGHNDDIGFYFYSKYNFYLKPFELLALSGYIGFDYVEKIGPVYSMDFIYGFNPKSNGNLAWRYAEDKMTNKRRWSLIFGYNHNFNDTTRIGTRIDSKSDSLLSKDFLAFDNSDMLRQEYNLSFSTTLFSNQSIGIDLSDTEQLNTTTSRYETVSRVLPKLRYNVFSINLIPFLYYSHNLDFTRTYLPLDDDYSYNGTFSPRVSMNTPKLMNFMAFSGNLALSSLWKKNSEKEKGWGDNTSSINTTENVNLNIIPRGILDSNITHLFSKQISKTEGLPKDGITSNQITSSLSGRYGIFNYYASTSYNMLKTADELYNNSELDRFSFLNLNGSIRYTMYYLGVNSLISIISQQIKNVSLDFALTDVSRNQLWKISASADFVNNLINAGGYPVIGSRIPDSITFSTALTFKITDLFDVSIYRKYDLMDKKIMEQNVALTWYVHCWRADFTWGVRQDNVSQFGFTISISAVPQFRFSKPTTAVPDYMSIIGNLQNVY
ncbi:MAG: LPS-assembly protein LptD [Candidatus Goldbacteria bacterium]|nr:LPS-assembly protein LptD [Candidatus Goldiibacteriota bacterium]